MARPTDSTDSTDPTNPTNRSTAKHVTDSTPNRAGTPARRTFLGTLAGVGLATAVSSLPVAAQDEEEEADTAPDDADDTDDTDDADDTTVEPELVVDFEPPELPENIAIDESGTIYLSLAVTGEIHAIEQDGSQETIAQIDVGEEGLLLGLVVDNGTIHAAVNSGEPETHGVWRVDASSGDAERFAELPADETEPNGIKHDPYVEDAVLVSDHLGGAIWRATPDDAEPWIDDQVLDPDPDAEDGVGADGLAIHPDGDVYVDNLDFGRIVRVPVDDDGSAGELDLIAEDESLVGADGLAFDGEERLYVAVNARDAIARVELEQEANDGDEPTIETLAEGGVFDFPADVNFGRTEDDETELYACNFAIGSFEAEDETAEPSLVRLDVETEGFFLDPDEFVEAEPI